MDQPPLDLSASLVRLAHRYDDAGMLLDAVRRDHPDASKKEVVLAALAIMIDLAQTDALVARKLHGFALDTRADFQD